MAQTHLELKPAFGDETVGGLRFVLRGDTLEASDIILRQGLRFTPGQDCVSANLLNAYFKAAPADGQPGKVCVLTVPSDFHTGYSVLNTAFISRADKQVIGAPMHYASARRHLSLYAGGDTESERMKIESEILNGSPLEDHPGFTLDYRNVLGAFPASPQLHSLLIKLEVSIRAFEEVDYTETESALTELFDCREPAQAVLVPTMVHALVVQMVESVVMSRLRMMRWEGLAALGYTIKEGSADAAIRHIDTTMQRREMEECRKGAIGSEIFSGELAWLKTYTLRELELMRIELDGSELVEGER
jgi:hypothetical protein